MEDFLSRQGLVRLSAGRFAVFLVVCVIGMVLLEEPVAVGGVVPDLGIIALTFGALRWGALGGTILGFGLGFFRDIAALSHLGLNALGMTVLGYGLGKARETLYLTTPGIDFMLLAGAKLALDVLVLGVAAEGAWRTFEVRFFWESPLSAVVTAVIGALSHRFLRRR
ncbi:MAG: rod shape-determining protein MreD [Gemmatimonadota bacterium]